ncbi:MAG: hypothetical protein ACJ780_10010 [Solirubrobacteraceae bacterium]|jgi:hypothetical protein
MERDVFTQQNEIGNDDPFSGSDFGDWEQSPSAETEDPTPIDPLPAETAEQPDPSPAEDAGTTGSTGEPQGAVEPPEAAPTPQSGWGARQTVAQAPLAPSAPAGQAAPAPLAPPPPPSPSQAAAVAENGPPAPVVPPAVAIAPPMAPQSPPAPASPTPSDEQVTEAPRAPTEQEAAGAPLAGQDGEPEDDAPTDTEEPTDQNGEVSDEAGVQVTELPESSPAPPPQDPSAANGDAPVPEETKDKRGRVTHRRYVILRADGNGKFSQLEWHEDKQRKLANKGTPNAKRQKVVLARGTEEALKFGYAVVGSPPKGAELVAVAAAYFQVKNVAPIPPEPMKQRLQIN